MQRSCVLALIGILVTAACLDRKSKSVVDGAASEDAPGGEIAVHSGAGGAVDVGSATGTDARPAGDAPSVPDAAITSYDGSTGMGDVPGTGGNVLPGTGGIAGAAGSVGPGTGGAAGRDGGLAGTGGLVATGGVASGNGGTAGAGTGGVAAGGVTGSAGKAAGGTIGSGGALTTGGMVSTGGTMAGGASAVGGAKATGGSATGGVATGGASGDTTPPTVTSITPANGTKGVLATSTITINFSEAMSTTSAASAISVSGLLPSDLNLAWNSAGTSVTITPTGGLVYATGTNPTGTVAKSYAVTVGAAARDLSGNTMTTASTASFTTLKRITWVMSPSIEYQTDTLSETRTACSDALKIGGWSATYSGGSYYSYMVFDLSDAGSPSTMYSIESARLFATQTTESGGFYAKPAHVEVWRLGYDGSMNLSVFPVLADVGTLASAATPATVSIDTLSSFKTDYVSNGVTGLLFKIAPVASGAWVSEQTANFTCAGFHLDMIYLMP